MTSITAPSPVPTDAPDTLPPPAGNEAGTVYAELWNRRYGEPPPAPKRRPRRKAKTT